MEFVDVYITGTKKDKNSRDLKSVTEKFKLIDGKLDKLAIKNNLFSMDKDNKFTIVVIPQKNKINTEIEFEYYAEGIEYKWWIRWYYQYFNESESGKFFIFLASSTICCLTLVFCCIFYQIY